MNKYYAILAQKKYCVIQARIKADAIRKARKVFQNFLLRLQEEKPDSLTLHELSPLSVSYETWYEKDLPTEKKGGAKLTKIRSRGQKEREEKAGNNRRNDKKPQNGT